MFWLETLFVCDNEDTWSWEYDRGSEERHCWSVSGEERCETKKGKNEDGKIMIIEGKRKFVSRGYVRFSAIIGEIVAVFFKELFYHFSRWRQVIFPEEPCQKVSIIIDIIILHREPIPILTRMKLCKKARILWHLWSTIIVISIDTTTIIAQLVKARQISIFERIWLLGYRVQEITEDAIVDRYLRLP